MASQHYVKCAHFLACHLHSPVTSGHFFLYKLLDLYFLTCFISRNPGLTTVHPRGFNFNFFSVFNGLHPRPSPDRDDGWYQVAPSSTERALYHLWTSTSCPTPSGETPTLFGNPGSLSFNLDISQLSLQVNSSALCSATPVCYSLTYPAQNVKFPKDC